MTTPTLVIPMTASSYLRWLPQALAPDVASSTGPAKVGRAVLGYAVGYDVVDVAPFVLSLRAVFGGAVLLVVDRKPALLAWLADQGVEAVIASDRLMHWTPHPVVARFAVYTQILQARPELGDVIATDVRDVLFQADPFADADNDLQFFVEAEDKALADHAFNLKHLRALLGEGLAQDLGRRSCVCVGVVAGPRDAMLRFCRALLLLCAIPRSNVGGSFGADQAACNVIAHLNLVGGRIRPNYTRVATIGLTEPDRLRFEGGRILNPDGSSSAIVHQYDRLPEIAAEVLARWGTPAVPPRGKKTLQRRVATARASLLRRLPELR